MTALEGEATADIDNNAITIKTTKEGTVDYSVQLVQPNLPFEKGATYQVQFDASASADREMRVDIKAPDHGYMSYMPHQDAQLQQRSRHIHIHLRWAMQVMQTDVLSIIWAQKAQQLIFTSVMCQ